jgi:hypothetical protein
MVLRTLGRYALKLKMNNEFNGAGHFLGLDDGKSLASAQSTN